MHACMYVCTTQMYVSMYVYWNENVIILMKFSSLAAPKVVILTTFGAASDEDFIKMKTFLFQCMWYVCMRACGMFTYIYIYIKREGERGGSNSRGNFGFPDSGSPVLHCTFEIGPWLWFLRMEKFWLCYPGSSKFISSYLILWQHLANE